MTIKVLIAESRILARQGLAQLLNKDPMIEVVGEAANGFDTVDLVKELVPDVVLMDQDLAGLDGISATRLIVQEMPTIRVIMLPVASTREDEVILESVTSGARGYIKEGADAGAVIDHIKRVASGGIALTEEVTSKLLDSLACRPRSSSNGFQDPLQLFTEREREVLDLVCHGIPNKEIASRLFISENTVRAHIRSLMQKLNVVNRTQLAIYAVRNGFGQKTSAQPAERERQPHSPAPASRTWSGYAKSSERTPVLSSTYVSK